jgi:nitroreductase
MKIILYFYRFLIIFNFSIIITGVRMNPIELIRKRRSSRVYLIKQIEQEKKQILEDYIKELGEGLNKEKFDIHIIEKTKQDGKPMKLNYGMIKNHNTYILGKAPNIKSARVSYGYMMEKIVLKATELNLGTCWIGYFEESYFNEISMTDKEEIPGIVILGYPTEKLSIIDRISRFTAKASTRKSWDELFFSSDFSTPLTFQNAGVYSEPLEMARLAPSSGNTQPWRILKEQEKNIFHFYKKPVSMPYEKMGLHEIDLGICMSHFELTSHFKGLKGKWIQTENHNIKSEGMEYIFSWIGE